MKTEKIENNLKSAVEKSTPDVFDKVLSTCKVTDKGAIMDISNQNFNQNERKKKLIGGIIAVAALLALIVGSVGLLYQSYYGVEAVIGIDVNPSIEMEINKDRKVLSVASLNEDGAAIIGDMDLKGSDLSVAVNALIGSMVRNGYITELANSRCV